MIIRDRLSGRKAECEAVLFDMDGTLVDSGACVERTWRRWCYRHGLDAEQLLRISHGRQGRDTIRLVAPHLDLEREAAWLTRAEEECREGIAAVPGANALLSRIPPDRWAVVTSAWRRLAEIRMACARLPLPKALVTSEDVDRGKPDPEGYLRAAELLGIRAEDCLVVEDSPAGLDAGRAGGMTLLAVTTTHTVADLGCDWCVGDLRPLEALT